MIDWAIFASGCVGALTREVLRWRRLVSSRRRNKYFSARFLLLSGVLVVLSGATALIFTAAIESRYRYVVAFVCGAGLEVLVAMASRLNIWMPKLPQGGTDEPAPATFAEYLRH